MADIDDIMNLPRTGRGVRLDVRGGERKSDIIFSKWHRAIPSRQCYYTDIDALEYRFENGILKLKAIFDIKEWHVVTRKYLEDNAGFKATKKLSELAGVPFYIVWIKTDENDNITMFRVWNTSESRDRAKEMTQEEMKDFIEKL